MSTQKLQGYQALNVVASDAANIPYTTVAAQGETSGTITSKVLNGVAGSDFITKRILAGDIVYNTSTGLAATVKTVDSDTKITLNASIFLNAAGDEYTIYAASAVTNYQNANNGCVLYIGTAGDLTVDTISGDEKVFFKRASAGFFPVQVKKVWSTGTTANDIVALW